MKTIPKWIWKDKLSLPDSRTRFKKNFYIEKRKNIILELSCDTFYNVYVNGHIAYVGWFYDFENYKYIDRCDITDFCIIGENELEISVWHYGVETYCASTGKAGLWFLLKGDDNIIAVSDENVLCKSEFGYVEGALKYITKQCGLTFFYDANAKDDIYRQAVITDKSTVFTADNEKIKNIKIFPKINGKIKKIDSKRYVIDLGKEVWGYITFELDSEDSDNLIEIHYSEDLIDNKTYGIHPYDDLYMVSYKAKKGKNRFKDLFRSIGCRYLEFVCEKDVAITYAGMIPVGYPLKEKESVQKNELDRRIYDTSIYTLKCCTGTHYMDCPWREQSSYVLDSRNQMLYDYFAFCDTEYARYNLLFFANSLNQNGLIPACPPGGKTVIPFFNLIYVILVWEYVHYTSDESVLERVEPALDSIMSFFTKRIDEFGLIPHFGKGYWNFYEWTEGNDNWTEYVSENKIDKKVYDINLNSAFVIAMGKYQELKKRLSKNFFYDLTLIRDRIKKIFYDEGRKLFKNSTDDDSFAKLGNGLAITAKILEKDGNFEVARNASSDKDITDISLSAITFFYDALLSVSGDFKDYIMKDLREKYSFMLSMGATTFWETIGGKEDFEGSGSLCHGWSAVPVYYLNKFKDD